MDNVSDSVSTVLTGFTCACQKTELLLRQSESVCKVLKCVRVVGGEGGEGEGSEQLLATLWNLSSDSIIILFSHGHLLPVTAY